MNNKGADQTARMPRLVCACVVRKPLKTGFLASRPISIGMMPFTANEALLIDRKFFGLIRFVVAVSYVNVQLKNIPAISHEKISFYLVQYC